MSQRDGATRLLGGFPSTAYSRLIVRYPYQSDGDYAHAYRTAAQRLASTYRGGAEDDLILIPYLMLYRHAFELQMKNMIRTLVNWHVVYGFGVEDGLRGRALEAHLRDKLGHRLLPIFNDMKARYDAMGDVEPMPPSIEKLISMLHEADKSGVSFRYAGGLPDRQENVDFFDLSAALDREFDWLSVLLDPLDAGFDAMPHPSEY